MANYKTPGVYIQDIASGSQSIEQASSSVGLLIGVTRNGLINVAQKIGSWTEFISKYASGLDTPFLENSYLPYAVHGFFTNGGKELYIGSVKKNAVKATKTGTKNAITVTASSEGAWGNDIKVAIAQNRDYSDNYKAFDVTISVGSNDSVVISEVTLDNIATTVMANTKAKQWIEEFTLGEGISELSVEEITLTGGTDGDSLTDTDYEKALTMIDVLDDVTFVAIPGQTSSTVNDAILTYCNNHGLFPIIDMPVGSTAEATRTYRKKLNAWTGALCYPWGKVSDPLTNTLKAVPSAGHTMGVYARIVESRGVHKAPAGTEATVQGFIEMECQLTSEELGTLNTAGVVCIISKPNAGIVIWGARSLNSSDSRMKYVTDGLINLNIKKSIYNSTEFAVFEPNDEGLWSHLRTICKSFLEDLRTSGTLKGTAKEAYYVTIDGTNNTEDSIANGELNIEIGYAPVKPAEFVIIKLAHSMN